MQMQTLWAEIALRETRSRSLVRHGGATMQDYMLRAVSGVSEEDITDDAVGAVQVYVVLADWMRY